MRLEILNNGYGLGAKVLFAMIRVFSGQPTPDAARLVFYCPEFYGTPMKAVTHEAMRGPSQWSVGDRELMAAFVSTANECAFCIGAHTATAAGAYHDQAKVAAVLTDLETAPVDERLRATLRMLGKLTRTHAVDVGDMREVLAAGVSPAQIEDALLVAFAFNTTNRLADAFGFHVLEPMSKSPSAGSPTPASTASSKRRSSPRPGSGCYSTTPCVSRSSPNASKSSAPTSPPLRTCRSPRSSRTVPWPGGRHSSPRWWPSRRSPPGSMPGSPSPPLAAGRVRQAVMGVIGAAAASGVDCSFPSPARLEGPSS